MEIILAKYYKKLVFLGAFVLTSLVFLLATLYLSGTFVKVVDEKNHAIGVERMINLSNEMVKDYNIIFQHTNKLAAYIEAHPNDSLKQMEDFVQTVLMPRDLASFFNRKNTDFVYAYVIAPEDMISVTYPVSKTNSPDIAFFNDPNSEYYLKLAKNNPGDVVVQGPLISPRNHQVLVYNRQAVYVNGKYWGYVGLCADFYKFLECVRLNVEDELFVYGIRSSIFKGTSDFIWGDNKLFKRKSVNTRQKSLFFGKQRWDLALKVKEGNLASRYFQLFYAVMFSLYIITLVVVMFFVKTAFSLTSVRTYDVLTRTINHDVFTQVVNKHLSDKDKEFGIVIAELVHFKQVNNIFGYKTGDEILIEITKRLHSVIGYNDKICRLGAEFFIFLDNIKSAVDVEKICSDIKSEMGTTVYANNYAVKQTVILGYSNSIEDGRDLKVLLHRANEVLDTNHDKYYKNSEDEL